VDERGDLVGRGSDCFAYDRADCLTRFVAGAACANPSPTATYAYDGVGKRTSKTVNGATTSYTDDAARGLPLVIDDGTRKYVWGPAGLAYSVDAAGVATTHHADALGSIRALSDASGATLATFSRDAWGNPVSAQGSASTPFGFAGELVDSETGFVYLRARMYDPQIGRFIQRDTYGGRRAAPGSLNRYAYAGNSPATYRDPSGRLCTGLVGGPGVLGGIGALAAGIVGGRRRILP
jgi:RHS repeat-associated protein